MRPQNETVNQIKMQQMITSKKKILILLMAVAFAGNAGAQIFNNGAEGFGNRVIGSGYNNGGGAEGWGNLNIGDGFNNGGGAEGFGNMNIGDGFNNGGGAEGFGNLTIGDGLNGGGNAEGFGNQEISPIGSGLFLLAGMAGAYALMRRRKDDEE